MAVASTGGNTIGWAETGQTESELGSVYLYLLLRDGTVYHGPMQFDLSLVPAGSTVMMTQPSVDGGAFALNILPGPNDSGGASLLQTSQVMFQAGEQAVVQDQLEASSLLSFSLQDLFPQDLGHN